MSDRRDVTYWDTSSSPGRPGVPMGPTARRLLEAARRLLERSGLDSLSLEAIAEEAGGNKALIRYHFGDKAGLVAALTEWLAYDALADMRHSISGLPTGPSRLRAFADDLLGATDHAPSPTFRFDLVAHVLGDESLRGILGVFYANFRRLVATGMAAGEPSTDMLMFATLTTALTDGLALQRLADPDGVDIVSVAALWAALLEAVERGHLEVRGGHGLIQESAAVICRP